MASAARKPVWRQSRGWPWLAVVGVSVVGVGVGVFSSAAALAEAPAKTSPAASAQAGDPATILPSATLPSATQSAAAHPISAALPEALVAALQQVEDFGFSFDVPAFYGLVAQARGRPDALGPAAAAEAVTDWRQFQERPGDFRGRVVAIEGRVGRNKDPFVSARYPELGEIFQMELHRADQPLAVTACFTQDVSDVPVGAWIETRGYFLMVRSYDAPGGRVRRAAVLVAAGPSRVEAAAGRSGSRAGLDWRWLTGALVVGLLATYIVLRRAGGPGRTDVRTLRATHAAPLDLSADLAEWSGSPDHSEQSGKDTPEEARPGG